MKQNLKQSQFTTILREWLIAGVIGMFCAMLMIGMILGAAVQEQNKLSHMAASEVCE